MPSKTLKQRKFMAAAANSPQPMKLFGINKKTAKEFNQADLRKAATRAKRSIG